MIYVHLNNLILTPRGDVQSWVYDNTHIYTLCGANPILDAGSDCLVNAKSLDIFQFLIQFLDA